VTQTLPGADSSSPQPARYPGHRVWGIYVAGDTWHVWTHAEVAQLGPHGIWGVLPIVVPPQRVDWWLDNHGYATLELLAREAVAWGVPAGSPLCLDVERVQSDKFGNNAADIARSWAVACSAHHLIPWAYGAAPFLDRDLFNNRWLADWPNVMPRDPDPPAGYRGWQYAGNVNGIDLDVFLANEIFLSPDLRPVTITEHGPVLVSAEHTNLKGAGVIVSAPAPLSAHSAVGATDVGAVPSTVSPPAPTAPTTAQVLEAVRSHMTAVTALLARLESPKR